MPKPSNASDYYNQIFSQPDAYNYLAGLPDAGPPVLETEWLEFKGCVNPIDGTAIPEADVAKYWSKALSGFANTAGGVLVWGLDARKDAKTGIDCVGKLATHPDADKLRQKLADLLLNAVVPPIRGVEMKAVKQPASKSGFVVCLIPEGQAKAYRAENVKQFYMRMSDNFDVPPAAVIRSLFFPQSRANLTPSIIVNPRTEKNPPQFWFCLKNEGTLTARDISVIIRHPDHLRFLPIQTQHIRNPEVLHETIPLSLLASINPEMKRDGFFGLGHNNPIPAQECFDFKIQISCEDSPVSHWVRRISHYDYLKNQRLVFESNT